MTLRNGDLEGLPEIDEDELTDTMYSVFERADVLDRMTEPERENLLTLCSEAAREFVDEQIEGWQR